MKEQFVTNAINLKSYSISEADKIFLMYSKEHGLIRGIAKGVKKTTSKLGGRMDLFVANKMILNKGRNLDTICQVEALNTFFNLRKDLDKLFYAMYCCEIITNFGTENDPNSEDIYNLFYLLLEKLTMSQTKVQVMLSVLRFQLKIMNISGYSLELSECIKCGDVIKDENRYFSVEQGGILCPKCAITLTKKLQIHKKICEFLETLSKEDFSTHTYYDKLATEKVCDICINLLKNYIEYYSPKRFKTSKILEGIK